MNKKRLCIGILAHVDAGKTTLSEAMLYTCGVIRKLGRVDSRDAFLDTYEMERERGITIFSKQAMLRTDDLEISLLDTPGHVDFSAGAGLRHSCGEWHGRGAGTYPDTLEASGALSGANLSLYQ